MKSDDVLLEKGSTAAQARLASAPPMAPPAADAGAKPVGHVLGEFLASHWRAVADRGGTTPWFVTRPEPRRWLLRVPADRASGQDERGLLPQGKVGMLVAGGGVGKTMALAQLAVAVATGRPWLGGLNGEGGFLTPDGGGRVLLALAEEDAAEMHWRLYNVGQLMRRTVGLSEADLALAAERIVVLPLAGVPVSLVTSATGYGPAEIGPSTLADELQKRLEAAGEWALVILDPLSRFAGLDTETDNAAATRFIQVLETLAKAPGEPTVLVAHHNTKQARRDGVRDGTGARGSSALTDGVRWVAELTNEKAPEGAPRSVPRMASLDVSKSNYAAPLDRPLALVRGEHGELRAASSAECDGLKVARVEAQEKVRAQASGKKNRRDVVRKAVEGVLAAAEDPAKGLSAVVVSNRAGAKVDGTSRRTVAEILEQLADERLALRPDAECKAGWRWAAAAADHLIRSPDHVITSSDQTPGAEPG